MALEQTQRPHPNISWGLTMHDKLHCFGVISKFIGLFFTQSSCKGRWTEVKLMYPAQDWGVADFALIFRWKHQPSSRLTGSREFELQVDDSADFSTQKLMCYKKPPSTLIEVIDGHSSDGLRWATCRMSFWSRVPITDEFGSKERAAGWKP